MHIGVDDEQQGSTGHGQVKLILIVTGQWRIQGGKSGHGPHRRWQWSLAPLGGRKSNDSIVNLSKCKDFAPRIDVGYGFGSPYGKYHIKTKKVIRNFWREINLFLGKAGIFFGKRLKNVVHKSKISPPFLKFWIR